MRLFLYIFLIVVAIGSLTAQQPDHHCSTPHVPMPSASQKAYAEAMTSEVEKYRNQTDTVIIPVVFHNMHYYHVGYVPDKAILETFDKINDALANRGEQYHPQGVDTRLRLCLAGKDPEGNPTTGITHQQNKLNLA